MSGRAKVQVINGITYPREVPMPLGLPAGWKAVEQAYGEKSKTPGMTYVRFQSIDGKKKVCGPKQVVQAHCEELGIPWEPEYAIYHAAFTERQANEAEAKRKEREANGICEGAKREEMIALSREHLGDLTGPIVLAFPGWKCRWDFLPDSQQTPKTFIAPDGSEWKLLKEVESMFGHKLSLGGEAAKQVTELVEAGRADVDAQALFSTGSQGAKDCMGSYLIDPANPDQEIVETPEERLASKRARKEEKLSMKSKRTSNTFGRDSLHRFSSTVHPPQTGWAALATVEDRQQGLIQFRAFLAKRKFPPDVELIAVHDVKESGRFAFRIGGIYYQLPSPVNGRRCYQKLKHSPDFTAEVCCDAVYVMWSAEHSRWQISCRPLEQAACIAYSSHDQEHVANVSEPWWVQQNGISDFQQDTLLKITAATV